MRKVKKGIVSEGYRVQVHLYGLGHERAGRAVKNVALVFYPRSGWLSDVQVWIEPYDRSVAEAALARLYSLANRLIEMDIDSNPQRFQLIDASPGDACIWCPFYSQERDIDIAADDKGCPGR